ncbi:MAG: universal stress protein [Geminicoccaceae bacterium]|nr:MAG: universal stress protein [Geminicoccaceae bacterium]
MIDDPPAPRRVFLVVADQSEEMRNALRFACRRAVHTDGHVALLGVIEPVEFQQWVGVGRVMEEEARAEVEGQLESLAREVKDMTGIEPTLYLRTGQKREQLLSLIADEPEISLLVLGTASEGEGPGPLVSELIVNAGGLRVPITLVPGSLSNAEIDALS